MSDDLSETGWRCLWCLTLGVGFIVSVAFRWEGLSVLLGIAFIAFALTFAMTAE